MIPDIPFIKGKIDFFLSAFLCFDTVQNGDNGRDKLIHAHTSCQKIRCVVGGVGVVLVKGHVVYLVITGAEHLILPGSEGGHGESGASAADRFDGRIQHLHDPAGFLSSTAVFVSGFVPHLPGAVHLISQAPELDIMRFFIAVLLSQVTVIGAARKVAVFQKISGFFRTAGA